MLKDSVLIEKLFERCGPVLRHRIAAELADNLPCDIEMLRCAAAGHPEALQNIRYYTDGAKMGRNYFYPKMVHGSKPEQLENTAGKLWALGMGKGIPEMDEVFDIYLAIMDYDFYRKNVMRAGYGVYQIAQLLGLLGYGDQERVRVILQARLDQLYHFVRQERYDIYVDIKDYPRPPSNWKDVDKIIDPALTRYGDAENEPPLPSVYDILGMVGMKRAGVSDENREKINAVLRYCYDERYQRNILPGYGLLLTPAGQYYSMGWSVHLPGYGQELDENTDMKQLLLWADLLSIFDVPEGFELFGRLLDFLETYRDPEGFYTFPREFIPEEKTGYFVTGRHMGLGENRRQKDAYALEATFRVLKLKKNLHRLEL